MTREQYRAYLVRRRDELEKLVGASKPAGHQTARAASFYLKEEDYGKTDNP